MPDDLPRPIDDGACDHLIGMKLPDIELMATDGSLVNLSSQSGKTVIYCYPMTGKPGVPLPDGWDDIPGAVDAHLKAAHSEIIIQNCLVSARMFLE